MQSLKTFYFFFFVKRSIMLILLSQFHHDLQYHQERVNGKIKQGTMLVGENFLLTHWKSIGKSKNTS